MQYVNDTIERLAQSGQHQLADYVTKVTPDSAKEMIIDQIKNIDFDSLAIMIDKYVLNFEDSKIPSSIEPAKYYSLDGKGPTGEWDGAKYKALGEEIIRASKVACFTVAGGQGSRLGYEGPKGCFPTSCVQNKPLFEIFAHSIIGSQKKYNAIIPWYIMTSPLNHDATVQFFGEHDYFGLDSNNVKFFQQGVMPSIDAKSGQILLSDPVHVATNPDGHGGAYQALLVSGALSDMQHRGIEHMSYFQVDNPHAMVVDPTFIGLHAHAPDSSGEFSSKIVAKSSWDEKVGVFCNVDGRTEIIEYSDLSEDLAKQLNSENRLAFNAGSIAIHIISTRFINKIVSDPDYALPFHRANKKVSHFDLSTGLGVIPEENNAVKLEKFVFDGIPLASNSIIVETDRVEEFAPVKNQTGADSIESSRLIQTERAARWLEAVGVSIPRDQDGNVEATIEISPLSATCVEDLKSCDLPASIESGTTVII
ncbi:MAG: UDPGP type 1 family protein [Phycisphaerales bacterium]|nr:UDPGP type 1 family protein [Phycisphaerales bacterium]